MSNESLSQRHADLHRQIDLEERRHVPNERLLGELKKEKLAIKDQLSNH